MLAAWPWNSSWDGGSQLIQRVICGVMAANASSASARVKRARRRRGVAISAMSQFNLDRPVRPLGHLQSAGDVLLAQVDVFARGDEPRAPPRRGQHNLARTPGLL